MEFLCRSVDETTGLAAQVATHLSCGDVVGLVGELGSGKTTFVQGVATAMNVEKNCYVNSPTFTILNIYHGRMPIYHFDFYRLNSKAELETIGFDEYIEGEGITIIEWADKFATELPTRTYFINFYFAGEGARRIIIPSPLAIRLGGGA